MLISRRAIILSSLGGLALVAVGGGAYRVTRTPETAFNPWNPSDETPQDPRLAALRYGILAPNPHNLQPWRFRLSGPNDVIVSHDASRRLPQTDPFDRQLTIGFGALLELTRIAAAERGVRVDMTTFPDGEASQGLAGGTVAHLTFAPDPATPKDPLFSYILFRRSTKEPYDLTRPVAAEALAQLMAEDAPATRIAATADPARVATLRSIVLDAGEIEGSTARTHRESVELMRIGHREIDANPDGIDLGGPTLEALALAGQLDRAQLADPTSQAFKAGADMQREIYGSIPAMLWIVTLGNARSDQLAAGRAYVRANLQATAMGLAMHPASQPLQEYPEMAEPCDRIQRTLAAKPGERVQMLVRVGHGPDVPPSPRWPLEAKLVRA